MKYTIMGLLMLFGSPLFAQQITSLDLYPQAVKAEDGTTYHQAMVVVKVDDATDLRAVQLQLGGSQGSNAYFDGLFHDDGLNLPPESSYRRVENTIIIRLGHFTDAQMSSAIHLCARLEGAGDHLSLPMTEIWHP